MAEDRIIVNIESQIDMEIAKLQMYLSQTQQAFGTRNVVQGAKRTQRATEQLQFRLIPVTDEMEKMRYQLAQLGLHDLPGLNREMRVILGSVPYMRQAMWMYFGFKREYTAIGRVIAGGMTGPAAITLPIAVYSLLNPKYIHMAFLRFRDEFMMQMTPQFIPNTFEGLDIKQDQKWRVLTVVVDSETDIFDAYFGVQAANAVIAPDIVVNFTLADAAGGTLTWTYSGGTPEVSYILNRREGLISDDLPRDTIEYQILTTCDRAVS